MKNNLLPRRLRNQSGASRKKQRHPQRRREVGRKWLKSSKLMSKWIQSNNKRRKQQCTKLIWNRSRKVANLEPRKRRLGRRLLDQTEHPRSLTPLLRQMLSPCLIGQCLLLEFSKMTQVTKPMQVPLGNPYPEKQASGRQQARFRERKLVLV